jgi:hypothetical protein
MISCKYISFLQNFVNFNGLKEGSKGADINEGKFVLNINVAYIVCFYIIALKCICKEK